MSTEPTNNTGHTISEPGGRGRPANPAVSSAYNDEAGSSGIPYKWLVVVAVVFGIFMSILDATIVNIALAKLQAVFGADLNQIQWVITAYLLSLAISIPLAGYLADRFGIKRVYMTALLLFTGGSMLCGLSWRAAAAGYSDDFRGISPATTWHGFGGAGSADTTCPSAWSDARRLYCAIWRLAFDILHQCAHWYHWFPDSGTFAARATLTSPRTL